MVDPIRLGRDEAEKLAALACQSVGADGPSTRSLVRATLAAEAAGHSSVGFPHLVDYLQGFTEGRINRIPQPPRSRPFPAFIHSDADGGVAQFGFDVAIEEFVDVARKFGVAIFSQRNSYSTGELGYYVRRLSEEVIIAIAATNANALLAASENSPKVYGTNPLAFGFPRPEGREPVAIDQASSETALVNIRAAAAGKPIPQGWAIGSDGKPTTDPIQGLGGALLPSAGRKGANIALMVEMLSAGVSGVDWSLDAADFSQGHQSPRAGLTIIAMRADGSLGAIERASEHVDRLAGLGVYILGKIRPPADGTVVISATALKTLKETIQRGSLLRGD